MPAAFNPEIVNVDQSTGADPSHSAKGSRFNDLNSRVGATTLGATVTEAIAEFKKGAFTPEDLKQLAFAMGFQVVEGKNTAAHIATVGELQSQVVQLTARAANAEAAFAAKENLNIDSVRAIATTMGYQVVADDEYLALLEKASGNPESGAEGAGGESAKG